jgi:hypothetical protein
MFEYHVAIRKMYNHKAVGFAVLCDDNANWKPTSYEYDQWGCGLTFTFRLIDWIMTLPEELDQDFQNEFHAYEKDQAVEYVTSFERFGIKKGLLESIALDLKIKFGAPGRKLLPLAEKLPIDELRKFMKFVKRAETLDEVREYLK